MGVWLPGGAVSDAARQGRGGGAGSLGLQFCREGGGAIACSGAGRASVLVGLRCMSVSLNGGSAGSPPVLF